MTPRPPRRQDSQVRGEMLANWLALLALLALGVVWPGEESAGLTTPGARSPAQDARSAGQGTPSLHRQASAGCALR